MRVASVAVVQNVEPTLMQALMSRGRRTHEHSSNVVFTADSRGRSMTQRQGLAFPIPIFMLWHYRTRVMTDSVLLLVALVMLLQVWKQS